MAQGKCSITGGEYEAGSYADLLHRYIDAHDADAENAAIAAILASPIWPGGTLQELETHSVAELETADTPEVRQRVEKRLIVFSNIFRQAKHHDVALTFLLGLYALIRRWEVHSQRRWHKGTPLWFLGVSYIAAGNRPDAEIAQLLALLEDVLQEFDDPGAHPASSLPAHAALIRDLGVAQETLAALIDGFRRAIEQARRQRGWDSRDPELTYLKTICSQRFWLRERAVMPFVREVAAQFLDVAVTAATNHEKGESLELLIAYLFECPGQFRVCLRSRGPDAENDVLVLNLHDKPISVLGDYFVASCKNLQANADVDVVRNLHSRLTEYRCSSGLLVSRNGITEPAARQLVKQEQRILICDFDKLAHLVRGRDRLSQFLIDEYYRRVFDLFEQGPAAEG